MTTLRVIMWDQLSLAIPTLRDADKQHDVILFCETHEACTRVKHHKKKLVLLLSAMRHFAEQLTSKGYQVRYVELTDKKNTQHLSTEITRHAAHYKATQVITTRPGDYKTYTDLTSLQQTLPITLSILEDDRFLISCDDFKRWAQDKKSLRMEFFYREMRKKYHILMNDQQPESGKWNLDAENRQFPATLTPIPPPDQFQNDAITQAVISLVSRHFPDHMGDTAPFHYAVTRADALKVLASFIDKRLPHFGDYQDVMLQGEPWLFHSHISLYLNIGLLTAKECISAAEAAYYDGSVRLAAAEGFIRQILGWREFIRGIYWLKMPAYKSNNYFNAKRPLPSFYWTADTKMNCISQCVSETKENAYAHHIQRLMVLGNFALLAGIDPDEVNEWYLIVYADAHEWVELPNVTGMILFADGGYLASKPYAASGAYIDKMSDYCDNCIYKVKVKNGPQACPYNYLYWDFLLKHQHLLKTNQRLSMIYSSLARMSKEKIKAIQADAELFLSSL